MREREGSERERERWSEKERGIVRKREESERGRES